MNPADDISRSTFLPVEPFEIVIFGGTGALACGKLLPALYHRFCDNQIPIDSRIVCTSRSKLSRNEYLRLITGAYKKYCPDRNFDKIKWKSFCNQINYTSLNVILDEDWSDISQNLDPTNTLIRIFYLATSPSLFSTVCQGLKKSGISHEESRVVLEKPLGHDCKSAEKINESVGQVFSEKCIYRIDHFLGKETVQNLLVMRFGNVLLEPIWNRDFIEQIEITVAEDIGTENRGHYYNHSGALRDMVQNHILQLLCLLTMEAPGTMHASDMRKEKIKILRALSPINSSNVKECTVRGQYLKGRVRGKVVQDYLTDVGVDESCTETFVAIKAEVDNWRWSGVPIHIRTGKRMSARTSEIVVHFKPVPHSIFGTHTKINPNKLVIRLQPDEAVNLWIEIKEPGAAPVPSPRAAIAHAIAAL